MEQQTEEVVRIFISYSHDSEEHRRNVLAVSERLRRDGIECIIDQYVQSPKEGWPRWMVGQIRQADFVLVVCTENYIRQFEIDEPRGKGRGAKWEGAIITQQMYDADSLNSKFIPVLLNSRETDIPLLLRSSTYYNLSGSKDYEALYRHVTKQPRVVPGAVSPHTVVMLPEKEPPGELKALLRDGGEAFMAGRFEEARVALGHALELADAGGHLEERINAKVNLAAILWHWDKKPEAAKGLLEACLEEVRNTNLEAHRALVLSTLGTVMGTLDHSDQAQNLLRQALDIDRKLGRRLSEGKDLLQLAWEVGHQGVSQETLELNEKALNCFLSVYHTGESEHQIDAIHGIAQSYFQRAKVCQREAKVQEAETNLMSCLEWQRKIEPTMNWQRFCASWLG